MPAGFWVFIGGAAVVILLCFFMLVHAIARSGIASDCKRDGFTWIDGIRYDCHK